MKKTLYWILIILFLAVLLFSGYKLYSIFREYAEGENVYQNTADRYTGQRSDLLIDDPITTPDTEPSGTGETEETEPEIVPPIYVDFDALLAENPDVVGWLYCEGTPINYPILQGPDNDKYLRRMIDGTYNSSGSIFMDYRCPSDLSASNTIIYGHNMKNEAMFGTLSNYSEQSYYEEHPVLWLLTPERDYRIDLIAGYLADANDSIYTYIYDQDEIAATLSEAVANSTFVSPVTDVDTSRIVTLSTCSYEYNNARYLLVGVLVG